MERDRPDIVAEVAAAFARYQQAVSDNDLTTLNELFHEDPRTLRFGARENLYGYEAIKAFRSARGAAGPSEQSGTVITTFGADFAVAATLFRRPGWSAKVGRLM